MEYSGTKVTIMCCSTCNVKCKHCYIEFNNDIDSYTLSNMINALKDRYEVSLNGSELLLNKEYIRLLKLIEQDRVLTNGLILHNNIDLMEFLSENDIKWICMSYHFKLHDIVSQVDKHIIVDNIKLLKERGFKIELMTTISIDNFNEVDNMVIEAISMGADCIRFTNLFNEGRTVANLNSKILNDSQINAFFDQFYEAKEKYKDLILVRRSGTFSRDYRKEKSSYFCPSEVDTVAIGPNMKVYPCPFLVKEGFEIGYYENGKIIIEDEYLHCKDSCLLQDILNRGKEYQKVKVLK